VTLRNSACRLRRTSYLRQPMKKTNCKAPDFQTFPSSARSKLPPGRARLQWDTPWARLAALRGRSASVRRSGDEGICPQELFPGATTASEAGPVHADVVRSELRRIAERGDGCRSGSRVELTWQAAGQLPDDRPAGLRSVLTSLRQTLPRRRSDRLCTVCIRPSTRAPTQ
jgi:hypothetical protein